MHTEVKEGDEEKRCLLTRNAKRNAIATTMTFCNARQFQFLTVDSVSTYGALLGFRVSFPLFGAFERGKVVCVWMRLICLCVYYDTETRRDNKSCIRSVTSIRRHLPIK